MEKTRSHSALPSTAPRHLHVPKLLGTKAQEFILSGTTPGYFLKAVLRPLLESQSRLAKGSIKSGWSRSWGLWVRSWEALKSTGIWFCCHLESLSGFCQHQLPLKPNQNAQLLCDTSFLAEPPMVMGGKISHARTFLVEKEMATHFSALAWRIPGMGKPGGLPSMGSHRVGHDWSNLAAAAAADLPGPAANEQPSYAGHKQSTLYSVKAGFLNRFLGLLPHILHCPFF